MEDFSRLPSVTLPICRPRVLLRDVMFSFRNVSPIEVAESVLKIKSNVIGLDGIRGADNRKLVCTKDFQKENPLRIFKGFSS